MNLPQAATAQPRKSAQVTVTLDAQGNLFLNQEAFSIEGLPAAIRKEMEPNQDLIVVLNADQSVNHGQVVKVMDQLRQVKGIKLAIATQKP